jgi:hypothetical protein
MEIDIPDTIQFELMWHGGNAKRKHSKALLCTKHVILAVGIVSEDPNFDVESTLTSDVQICEICYPPYRSSSEALPCFDDIKSLIDWMTT